MDASAAASASAGPGPVIEVERLVKRYGGRAVVDGVSFRVERGEVFALLGPNGAGKTTTVEILEGYRRADDGRVRVLGDDPAGASRDHRARVGLMLQGGGGVDPRMTAREVLALHAAFHQSTRPIAKLLDLVGLGTAQARTRYRRLSGGERQRLGLALALVGRPELVALDEPTAGLDVEGRAATRDLLGRLREEAVTVLVTSHDLGDVEKVADRIAILDRGRVVAMGLPAELAAGAGIGVRFRLVASIGSTDRTQLENRLRAVDGAAGAALADESGGRYAISGAAPSPPLIAALTAWCEERGMLVVELRSGAASLEERYLELVGGAASGGEEVSP
ncbi:MAG: ABC transporter ATP-binding protein [Chloroflexota bacterium]